MDETYSTQELLAARELTRTIGEIVRAKMNEYVATLAPLFRPRSIFGDYIQGSGREPVKGADQSFKELQELYETVATSPPFNLPKELRSPLMQMTSSIELSPVEYEHPIKTARGAKTVTVTSPFKSVVSYATYTPKRLREVLANRNRNEDELQQFVLHYLAMHVVISKQPGLPKVLESLHFPIGSIRLPGLGQLPFTQIASAISTSLPADDVVVESTNLSGKDAFEEIVNVEDVAKLRDVLKERLQAIADSARSK